MFEIIVYSIIGIIATASFTKLLYFSIQDEQIFGAWQKVLLRLDRKGSKLVKPLGWCETCFCLWLAMLSWGVFFLSTPLHLGGWWVLHYLIYTSITSNVSLYFLTKLFK